MSQWGFRHAWLYLDGISGRAWDIWGADAPRGSACVAVTEDGIDGWLGTPDPKWELVELQSGDGSHDVEDDAILYSSRVVTVSARAYGETRAEAFAQLAPFRRAAHRKVALRVQDGGEDTFVTGLASLVVEKEMVPGGIAFTLTVTCPDPRRYATRASACELRTDLSQGSGGLWYSGGSAALSYPLYYGRQVEDARNVGTLHNAGTAAAWPTVTVTGPIGPTVRIACVAGGGRHVVEWAGRATGTPLVLDFLSRRATMGGLDVSRQLVGRGFAPVPPGGDMRLALDPSLEGDGWARCEVRDTYV